MSEWLVWRWQPGTGTRPLPGSRQQSSLGGDPVSFDLALPAGGPPAPDHLWLLRAPCRPGPWFHGGFVHRAPGCEPQKPPSRACEPLSEPVAAEGPGPRPGPPPPWTPGAGGAGDPRGVGGCRERACSPCRWSKADLHGGRGVAGAGSVLVETSPASGHTVTAGAGAGRRGGRPPSTVGGSGRGGGSVRWPRAHGAQPPRPSELPVVGDAAVLRPDLPLRDAPAQGRAAGACQWASFRERHSPWVQGHLHCLAPVGWRKETFAPLGAAQEAPRPLTEPTNLGSSALGLRPPQGSPSSLISPSLSPVLEGQRRGIGIQELTGHPQPWGRGKQVGFRGSKAGS